MDEPETIFTRAEDRILYEEYRSAKRAQFEADDEARRYREREHAARLQREEREHRAELEKEQLRLKEAASERSAERWRKAGPWVCLALLLAIVALGTGAAFFVRVADVPTRGQALDEEGIAGPVRFLGIPDKATRVVYVLDRSGSMAGEPLQLAKAELIASLESLQSNQQYQVIFYNTEATAMRLDGENDALYSASDVNRTKTRQYVNGIVADAGTNDLPAILKALSFQPEVIFLLTDGEGLTAADLGRIRQSNRSDARIHCVRFGIGSELAGGGYIERLAEQNGGTYLYCDSRGFRKG
ncbi:MAG: hypothetical protein WD066_16655 [Planctomycetaceae bacterium]